MRLVLRADDAEAALIGGALLRPAGAAQLLALTGVSPGTGATRSPT